MFEIIIFLLVVSFVLFGFVIYLYDENQKLKNIIILIYITLIYGMNTIKVNMNTLKKITIVLERNINVP